MWYKLVKGFEKNQFLVCYEDSNALWKKEIPYSYNGFLECLKEENKNNLVVDSLSEEQLKNIPLKSDKKEGIEYFWKALKEHKMLSNGQKIAICAQSVLESAKGTSWLAVNANNFCGMMWRTVFEGYTGLSFVEYTSPSDNIKTNYLKCATSKHFLTAYLLFISRDIYKGWEEKKDALSYITHLKSCGYATDVNYITKVSSFFEEASVILGIEDDKKEDIPVDGMPKIDITEYDSPNQSERGATITGLVVHNTASSFSSALNWLCNPQAQASCHLIIRRDGRVACIVPFSKKAWHAGPANSSTIGIEIEATNNQKGMTKIQEEVLVRWIKWFMKKYGFNKKGVITHRSVMNTDCPILIWETEKIFNNWKDNVL